MRRPSPQLPSGAPKSSASGPVLIKRGFVDRALYIRGHHFPPFLFQFADFLIDRFHPVFDFGHGFIFFAQLEIARAGLQTEQVRIFFSVEQLFLEISNLTFLLFYRVHSQSSLKLKSPPAIPNEAILQNFFISSKKKKVRWQPFGHGWRGTNFIVARGVGRQVPEASVAPP
jgi:hypothetical protein